MFTRFADNHLWEYHVFSFEHARALHKSQVFAFTFHLFLLLEALQGFERYWKSLGGSGMVWKALEGSADFARFCEALGVFERLREALGGFGTPCEVLQALDGFIMFWEAFF